MELGGMSALLDRLLDEAVIFNDTCQCGHKASAHRSTRRCASYPEGFAECTPPCECKSFRKATPKNEDVLGDHFMRSVIDPEWKGRAKPRCERCNRVMTPGETCWRAKEGPVEWICTECVLKAWPPKTESKHSSASSEEIIGGSEMPRPTFDTEGDELLNLTGWEKVTEAAYTDCVCGHHAKQHGIGWGAGKHVRFRFTKPPTPIKGTACSDCSCDEFTNPPAWAKGSKAESGCSRCGHRHRSGKCAVCGCPPVTESINTLSWCRQCGHPEHFHFDVHCDVDGCTCQKFVEMAWHGHQLTKHFDQPGNTFTGKNVCWRCGHHLPAQVPGHPRFCPQCWTPSYESVALVNAMLDEEICSDRTHYHAPGIEVSPEVQLTFNTMPLYACQVEHVGGGAIKMFRSVEQARNWLKKNGYVSTVKEWASDEMCPCGDDIHAHLHNEGACKKCPCKKYGVGFQHIRLHAGEAMLNEALTQDDAQVIQSGINAPWVKCQLSTLGGVERATVIASFSLEPKEAWAYNIFENSPYARFFYESNGELRMVSGSGRGGKRWPTFRKTRAASAGEAVAKINAWIAKVSGQGEGAVDFERTILGVLDEAAFRGDPQDKCDCGHVRSRHRTTTGCDDCECGAFSGEKATKWDKFTPEECHEWKWSPEGEARSFVSNKGAYHTSMSVGDVIVMADGTALMVDSTGFTPLAEGKMREEFEEDFPTCPMCGGPGVPLGRLGRLEHYRCRNCGMDFNREIDEGFEATIKAELAEASRVGGKDITVGATVKYSRDFLRSTGMMTGDVPFAKGTVTALEPLGGSQLATVDWGEGGRSMLPNRVRVTNLVAVKNLPFEEAIAVALKEEPKPMKAIPAVKDPNTIAGAANNHPCEQCGKPNYGWILGPVCGNCARANHARVAGGKVKVNRKPYTEEAPKLVSALLGEEDLKYHQCGDAGEEVYDAQGIYLCTACPKCKKAKLAGYRPEILTGYDQSDVDEPIEPEEAIVRPGDGIFEDVASDTAEFIAFLKKAEDERTAKYFPKTAPWTFGTDNGPSYIRIWMTDGTQKSVVWFVKQSDGTIWYPAGWKGPARNFSRGNVHDRSTWEKLARR